VTGFSAGPGYDPVTGLGSADGYLLVNSWKLPPAAGSFQVSAAAAALTVTQGTSGTVNLTVATTGTFSSAVTFSAGTLPAGLTAAFVPASLPAPGAGSSKLTLTAGTQIAPGIYNLMLSGSAGSTRTVPLAVTVLSKCVYTLGAAGANEPATAASDSVTVTTTAGCAWTAVAGAPWITVSAPASGSGNGKVSYSLAANTTSAARTGSIVIGGLNFTVNQAAPPFSLSPTQASFGAAGGSGTINIGAATSSSSWTAASNVTWIGITGAGSGTGNKTLSYSVMANTAASGRTGTLTVAGRTFTVAQAALTCTYNISLSPTTSTANGLTGSISVQTNSGCAWTAVSNASWITVSSGVSGTGNGTVKYAIAVNTGNSSRSGTLLVAGYKVTVTEGVRGAVRLTQPVATTSYY
jgi:hypothetical protein